MNKYKALQDFSYTPAGDEEAEKEIKEGEILEMNEEEAEPLLAEEVIELVGAQNDNPPPPPPPPANEEVGPENAKEVVVIGKAGGKVRVYTRNDGEDFVSQAQKLAEDNGFTVEYK